MSLYDHTSSFSLEHLEHRLANYSDKNFIQKLWIKGIKEGNFTSPIPEGKSSSNLPPLEKIISTEIDIWLNQLCPIALGDGRAFVTDDAHSIVFSHKKERCALLKIAPYISEEAKKDLTLSPLETIPLEYEKRELVMLAVDEKFQRSTIGTHIVSQLLITHTASFHEEPEKFANLELHVRCRPQSIAMTTLIKKFPQFEELSTKGTVRHFVFSPSRYLSSSLKFPSR